MEIEMKFIYSGNFNLEKFKSEEIVETYINLTGKEERVRQKGDKFYHTMKSFGDLKREEMETRISKEEYLSLLGSYKLGSTICKTRYYIPLKDNLTAEVDIYHNALKGLKTVEVEFQNLEDAENFNPPTWFGKELTNDRRYKNSSLAISGLPDNSKQQ